MKDARVELITGLKSAIDTKSTGLTVYTKVPKSVVYPYIYITDIFDIEDGSKQQFMYQYDVSIEIVYSDITDKAAMWGTVNSVKEIINNRSPFAIGGNFNIMSATLIETTETEDLVNSQEVNVTIIRVNFEIEDNN